MAAGFVAQFGLNGDTAVAAAWSGRRIDDDSVKASNVRGMVTFALGGPKTRTTQLLINHRDNSRLDATGFSPFGQVVAGRAAPDVRRLRLDMTVDVRRGTRGPAVATRAGEHRASALSAATSLASRGGRMVARNVRHDRLSLRRGASHLGGAWHRPELHTMTADDFRKIALGFPDTAESAHMNHPDFRVRGKVFATLGFPNAEYGIAKLTQVDQQLFIQADAGAFSPLKGAWGERGFTCVRLKAAKKGLVREALRAAWEVTGKGKKK